MTIRKYEKLQDDAKCNYQCDQLATLKLQEADKTSPAPEVIDFPTAKIYLTLDGQTITSQFKKQCLDAIPRKEYEDYLERKFNWMRHGSFQYDWKNFGTARRSARPGLQVFITKLMFRLLPTAAREQQIGLRTCNKCKQCGEEEDIQHLFLCYKRNEWLPNLAFAVNKYCHAKDTKKSVREYFKQLFNEFKRREKHATEICMELFCGLIRNSLIEANGPLCDERDQWVRGLIRLLWEHAFKAWDHRNKSVHGTNSSVGGRERENTINTVRGIIDKSTEMSELSRTMIYPDDMDSLLNKSTTHLKDWILRNKKAIEVACTEYEQDSIAHTKQLEKYFSKKTFSTMDIEEHHSLSDEDGEDDETQETEGEFRRMLRTTHLLSYFPLRKLKKKHQLKSQLPFTNLNTQLPFHVKHFTIHSPFYVSHPRLRARTAGSTFSTCGLSETSRS